MFDSQTMGTASGLKSGQTGRALRQLRALLLLGGSVRPTQMNMGIGRSLTDLPIDGRRTVLDHWRHQAMLLARDGLGRRLSMRIIIDRASSEPRLPVSCEHVLVSVERDPYEYRGTGGLLRDLSAEYRDDDYVLVAGAAHVLLDPLTDLVHAMAQRGGDVVMIAHRDDTPSGLMLVRCGCLRTIASEGFVDMKEQALPAIARRGSVLVERRQRASGLPIRTLSEYLEALRRYHRRLSGETGDGDPFREAWRATFGLVEEGARVDSGVRVHNSVVLNGARIEGGAVIVHSVVCGQAVVRRDRMVVDQIVTGQKAYHEGVSGA